MPSVNSRKLYHPELPTAVQRPPILEPTPNPEDQEFEQAPEDQTEYMLGEEDTEFNDNATAYRLGAMARRAVSAAGESAMDAGHAIQTIMTKDGPVQVETAPEVVPNNNDELSDLFEVPQEEDNDMYTDDLFSPPEEEEVGDLVGEGDMSDLLSMDDPITPPKGRRIVKVLKRFHTRKNVPTSLGGTSY